MQMIYKIKDKSDGRIERYKVQLVMFGNTQVKGLDYHETFVPIVKTVTVRVLLTVAAFLNWEVHQMHVDNTFLHSDMKKEIYIKILPGFSYGYKSQVC